MIRIRIEYILLMGFFTWGGGVGALNPSSLLYGIQILFFLTTGSAYFTVFPVNSIWIQDVFVLGSETYNFSGIGFSFFMWPESHKYLDRYPDHHLFFISCWFPNFLNRSRTMKEKVWKKNEKRESIHTDLMVHKRSRAGDKYVIYNMFQNVWIRIYHHDKFFFP